MKRGGFPAVRTRVLAALALVTLAVAACASAPSPAPRPEPRQPPSGGYVSLGLADIPAAPRKAPKTLSESESRGIVSLAQFVEFAAALVHETR